MNRSGFLVAAAALAVAPSALADGLPDSDLAHARLLVAVELLLLDFYGRAVAAKRFRAPGLDVLRRAQANEAEHLTAVSGILTGAGQVPATADDIDFAYPARTFASAEGIARVGQKLEQLALGAYLGAVDGVRATALKQPLARIAACEAQHLAAFRGEATGHELGQSFPPALTIDEASDALDAYTG